MTRHQSIYELNSHSNGWFGRTTCLSSYSELRRSISIFSEVSKGAGASPFGGFVSPNRFCTSICVLSVLVGDKMEPVDLSPC